ncbi:hypothetical protein CCMA1212_010587 [Trichoderma ghanense]|uniref:Uncharacterized protein n=1 Tax=Trichoderma ghanense TaxID=65468 RepID=A0ABY2GQX9_9HYPO
MPRARATRGPGGWLQKASRDLILRVGPRRTDWANIQQQQHQRRHATTAPTTTATKRKATLCCSRDPDPDHTPAGARSCSSGCCPAPCHVESDGGSVGRRASSRLDGVLATVPPDISVCLLVCCAAAAAPDSCCLV